jgi:hypothetical protein
MWQTLVTLAPVLARLAMLLLDKAGADAQEKKEFLEMITKSTDDANAPIKMKDDFKNLRARLKERVDATKNTPA